MRTLANIIWHIPFLGFLNALGSFIVGGILVLTVVGAPIGLGLIQYSKFLMAPFSYAMVSKDDLNIDQNLAWKAYSTLVWIFYLPFGIILWIITVVQIVSLFCSIIGIPVAIVLAKSLGTYFNPVNKKCVDIAVRDEINRVKAQRQVRY